VKWGKTKVVERRIWLKEEMAHVLAQGNSKGSYTYGIQNFLKA